MKYTFKVANMAKPQDFTLYPYSGGDTITLQSSKRFAVVNLRSGEGRINAKSKNYAGSVDLVLTAIAFTLPEEIKTQIQSFLWHNNGKKGNIQNCVSFENKPLF